MALHLVKGPLQAVKEQVGSHYSWFLPHTCEIKIGERIQRSESLKDLKNVKILEVRGKREKKQSPSLAILNVGSHAIYGCFDYALNSKSFSHG